MLQVEQPRQLAIIRERLGLNQSEMARKLGISRQHLSKLENSADSLSPKLSRKVADLCRAHGLSVVGPLSGIRAIPVRSWAQAGIGRDFEELPFDWQRTIPTDCPDDQAFAVEVEGDSMEPKFLQGDIAVIMPSHQPKNGSLVVARLEREGIVFKVFTARQDGSVRQCSFASYHHAYRPIEVSENSVIWNFPVYQVVRQVWR
ncbi:MAG: helix-turn-helix domain-containing protein [Verrucomicrobia bacterium]|nr:helix-turn-helix domain-containing protein [Verrucomicrobiota bacterium]